MAKSREELVKALERARRREKEARRQRRLARKAYHEADDEHLQRTWDIRDAQDALQQWDEDHYGEDS